MKTPLTLALASGLTGTAFAVFQAPLPEFKTEKQLAVWRAEMAAKATSQGYSAEPSAFYTGKPYVESSGDYAFKYRSYNPDLARWTSEDPSGFPDGANASIYAPTPTSGIDALGLFSGEAYGPSTYGASSSLLDVPAWNAIEAYAWAAQPCTYDSMQHADNSLGAWNLSGSENAAAKAASQDMTMYGISTKWTSQVSQDLRAAFGNMAAGTYNWTGVTEHAHYNSGDLHNAIGGCFLTVTGSVVITNNNGAISGMMTNAAVTLYDWYSFAQYTANAGNNLPDVLGLGYRLQMSGYIQTFSTNGSWHDDFSFTE